MQAKELHGYPGYYASSDGSIYSYRTGIKKRLSTTVHKGYYHVFIRRGIGRNTAVKLPVHQLILFAFVGDKPFQSAVCRHLNGDPFDNRVENLRWGTTRENVQDSVRHGTAAFLRCGERANACKLDASTVCDIERKAKSGEKEASIALEYGISQKHVSSIKLHQTWKHLWTQG